MCICGPILIPQTSSTRVFSLETMYWNLGSVASSGTCSPGSWCKLKSRGGSFELGKAKTSQGLQHFCLPEEGEPADRSQQISTYMLRYAGVSAA
jgi:hypothetical protein